MSSGGYEDYFRGYNLGPPWLHGPWAQKLWKVIGAGVDEQNDLLRAARQISTPDGALDAGDSDAVTRIGDDRLLARGGTTPGASDETDEDYVARLKKAWTTWGQDPDEGGGAGSALALLQQLAIQGFPVGATGATLVNHLGRWYQLRSGDLVFGDCVVAANRQNLLGIPPGNLPGFTLDVRDQFFSRFVILFLQDVPGLDDGGGAAKAALNQTVSRWKSGGAIYDGALVLPPGQFCWDWSAGLTWDTWRETWDTGTTGSRFINPE